MFIKIPVVVVCIVMICLSSCKADSRIPKGTIIDSIVVIKHKRQMQVYSKRTLVKSYDIALGKQPKGHKQVQGDMRTPEGIYHINGRNPGSKYYKNLGISYPNNADREQARKLGKSPGGDVKIHGLPNGKAYIGALHRLHDWTHGCIAVTNYEMDELYNTVETGAVINILQ